MSDPVSKLDLHRYREQVDTAFRDGSSRQKVWEDLIRSGCPKNLATTLTGHPERLANSDPISGRSTDCLEFLLLGLLSFVGAVASGWVVHRILEHWLINSAFGPGSFEAGLHIVNKQDMLSNGQPLPGVHRLILNVVSAGTVLGV
jgi:hypothetical protein